MMTPTLALYINKIADDLFILGHRHSEWIGIGPTLEEDIAFGSLAQDKVGQSLNLYQLLNKEAGYVEPDAFVYTRTADAWRCCQFVEQTSHKDYAEALMIHFMYDHAHALRLEGLTTSSNVSLSNLAKKFKSEIKYHTFHANTWVKSLAEGSLEAKQRLQAALNGLAPYISSLFEPVEGEETLVAEGLVPYEQLVMQQWHQQVTELIQPFGLEIPTLVEIKASTEAIGGRTGQHTEHLAPMLHELTEVHRIAPNASW